MMTKVILDEAGNEEIAVVVTRLHAQSQGMTCCFSGLNQSFGLELIDQKIITITLIYQNRQFLAGRGNQDAGIPLTPT